VRLLGKSECEWFKQSLNLPHGIPSHDILGRVCALLDTEESHVDQDADCVLVLQENQGHLCETFQDLSQPPAEMVAPRCDYHKTAEKALGRIEVGECWTASDPDDMRYISEQLSRWPGLRSLAMVRSERSIIRGEGALDSGYRFPRR